jgi:hypothetical protein
MAHCVLESKICNAAQSLAQETTQLEFFLQCSEKSKQKVEI